MAYVYYLVLGTSSVCFHFLRIQFLINYFLNSAVLKFQLIMKSNW